MDDFEMAFASMWKTAKERGISRKDIAEQIKIIDAKEFLEKYK